MGNLLYLTATILLMVWATGFIFFNSGGIFNIFLFVGVFALLLQVLSGKEVARRG